MTLPPVAILAGGLATRLHPITQTIPKSLIPIAGRPFLAHQLEWLRTNGIQDVVLCIGHLGEQIQEQFRDGKNYNLHLRYSFDGEILRGTGGALQNALPLLGSTFFVLYGDSYLPTELAPVYHAFLNSKQPGLMTVFRNQNRWDTSNVCFREGMVEIYRKTHQVPEMEHIDYGLMVLNASVIGSGEWKNPFDLALPLEKLAEKKVLAGYETSERFYEIGSQKGLQAFESWIQAKKHHGR